MIEIAPDICSGRISSFLEIFALANTQANTCAYLSLMRHRVLLLPHWTNNHYPMP